MTAQQAEQTADAISAELAQVSQAEDVIVFAGRPFKVAEKFGLMPLIRLGYLSKKGIDVDEMDGAAAMYDVIRSAIADDEWDAFMEHATDVRADGEELMAAVQQAVALISSRPTRRPSDSSAGPPATETSSSDASSSPGSLTPRELQRREQVASMQSVDEVMAASSLTLVPGGA